jgi:hypothetical protein
MSTKQLVTIGQRWRRRRGGEVHEIRQVWRADRQVRLIDSSGNGETVAFTHLRRYYVLEAS